MKNLLKLMLILVFMMVIISKSTADVPCNLDGPGGAYVTLADKFGGEISTKELKTVRELGIAGCAKGSKVYAFILEIKSKGKMKRYTGDSNSLSKEILYNLGILTKGDTFIFIEIKANLPTGGKIDALGRTFTVV